MFLPIFRQFREACLGPWKKTKEWNLKLRKVKEAYRPRIYDLFNLSCHSHAGANLKRLCFSVGLEMTYELMRRPTGVYAVRDLSRRAGSLREKENEDGDGYCEVV